MDGTNNTDLPDQRGGDVRRMRLLCLPGLGYDMENRKRKPAGTPTGMNPGQRVPCCFFMPLHAPPFSRYRHGAERVLKRTTVVMTLAVGCHTARFFFPASAPALLPLHYPMPRKNLVLCPAKNRVGSVFGGRDVMESSAAFKSHFMCIWSCGHKQVIIPGLGGPSGFARGGGGKGTKQGQNTGFRHV